MHFAANAFRQVRSDKSEADFAVACKMFRAGYNGSEVIDALAANSPGLDARKRGHIPDYLHRTVSKAAVAVERDCRGKRQGRELEL